MYFKAIQFPKTNNTTIVRMYWPMYLARAKRDVEQVSEDVQSRQVIDSGRSHFYFNDNVVIDNEKFRKEVKGSGSGKTQDNNMWTKDGSMRRNSIMDGLPKAPPKREYMMTNRVPKIIRG